MSNRLTETEYEHIRTYLTVKYGGILDAMEAAAEPNSIETMGSDYGMVHKYFAEMMAQIHDERNDRDRRRV